VAATPINKHHILDMIPITNKRLPDTIHTADRTIPMPSNPAGREVIHQRQGMRRATHRRRAVLQVRRCHHLRVMTPTGLTVVVTIPMEPHRRLDMERRRQDTEHRPAIRLRAIRPLATHPHLDTVGHRQATPPPAATPARMVVAMAAMTVDAETGVAATDHAGNAKRVVVETKTLVVAEMATRAEAAEERAKGKVAKMAMRAMITGPSLTSISQMCFQRLRTVARTKQAAAFCR